MRRVRRDSALNVLQYSNVHPFKWSKSLYMCFYCDSNFADVDQFKDHNKLEHDSLSADKIKKSFLNLKKYELVKVNISDVSCKLCADTISDFDDLKRHLRNNHNKTIDLEQDGVLPFKLAKYEFNCGLCSKKYSEYKTLNVHMNIHFQNYICEQCGVGFISPDRLRNHIRKHGSTSYACDACDKVFRHVGARKEHYAVVHMNAKTSRCPHCFETFKYFYQKKKHITLVHGLQVKKFQCDLCPKIFMLSGHLRMHKRLVHLNLKRYSCDVCDLKFFYKCKLRNHMISHVGERKYQCQVCKKAFARNYTLTEHMRIHSGVKKN